MKWIGALMAAAACLGFGGLKGWQYVIRVNNLEKILDLLNLLYTDIRYTACSLPQWIADHRDEQTWLSDCSDRLEKGVIFPEAWRFAIKNSDFLDPEKNMLTDLGESLGQSDTEGQLSLIELGRGRLLEILKKAKEEKQQQLRVCPVLGAAAGAVLLLLCL